MKKSIFLFFAAILCAMSVSAKVIYFKPNGNWAQGNANFYAHVWGGSGATSPVKFTPVATDPDVYEAEVGTHTSIIFLRMDPSKTVTSSNMWNKPPLWDRMGNLSIPTNGNNCCTIKDGEWSQETDNASSHVTWSTYTPPTEVVIPDRYITGTIAGGWNANDVKMTYDEATETYSHTFTAVAAGELHQFKVTDGTWSKNWGGDAVSPAIEGVTTGSDGNVAFTLSVGGDVTITFKDSKIQLTTTGSFTPVETFDYYVVGSFNGWNTADAAYGMTKDGDVYKKEVTFAAAVQFKVCNGTWDAAWGANNLGDNKYTELGGTDNLEMKEEKTFTIIFDPAQNLLTFEGLTPEAVVTYDYYIAGTLAGGWSAKQQGMTKDGELYKATFSELNAGEYQFKITDGQFNSEGDNTHEHTTLGAAYEEVSYSDDGNIKISTEEAINLTVIFNAATDKITFDGLTELPPAEPVTVYFINSGEWAEVACHYWGGLNGSAWPGVQMDLTAETYEAEGWNVYKVTFPGDNTSCIFNNNNNGQQTGDLTVENGKYYCYANGIWYERLADVDPLDTRVYLKGAMNEWCDAGYCDMFRKETVDGTVAYRTTWLEAETTYEFKIEDAGTWLSNEGTMDKENCTDWLFEEGLNNAKITTEYAGDYTFVWDMTTKKLSVVYPELVPTEMDLVVTNMVFDGDMTFSGSDNEYGIVFNLVVGDPIEEGVFALDASSTVDFGGMPFTNVTGMIAPDMNTFASATAVVKGFLGGSEYFQFNIDMSAGGGTSVEIWDGVATPNDGTGELTISANWDGDDVYVVVPGFDYANYECPEVWFYVGGTTWETASIAAYGPATITVEDGGVLVEGSVMSGVTGTSYELMVFGLLPVVEPTPDYTRAVTPGYYGTICLPFGSSDMTGATFFETSHIEGDKVYFNEVTTLVAGHAYIFLASASEIAVVSDGTEVATPEVVNGLHGTFDYIGNVANVSLETEEYIIVYNSTTSQCELSKCGVDCSLEANRAYVVLSEIGTEPVQLMPGCRRIGMSVQGENEATGFENITAPEGQAIKAIVNGQLIIIRGGEKFNAQGVRF